MTDNLSVRDGNYVAVQVGTKEIAGVHYPKHLMVDGAGADALPQLIDAIQHTPASGKTAVTGTFTATGQSGSFTPLAGRDFNIGISGGVGTLQVERRFDGAGAWYVVLPDSLRIVLPESFTLNEPETGVEYRLNCTAYTSGTFTYRVSQ